MSKKHYNKQVIRSQRVRKTTLVVGVDIGNAFNAMGFMNKDGNVLVSKLPPSSTRHIYVEK